MVQNGGMVEAEDSDDALAPGDPIGRLMQRIDAVKSSFEEFGASLVAEGEDDDDELVVGEDEGFLPRHYPPTTHPLLAAACQLATSSAQHGAALPAAGPLLPGAASRSQPQCWRGRGLPDDPDTDPEAAMERKIQKFEVLPGAHRPSAARARAPR
jgi:hypothetical protein